jgi:murein DD-endopeptidase MepM/ murein hydrolase activator NlpD
MSSVDREPGASPAEPGPGNAQKKPAAPLRPVSSTSSRSSRSYTFLVVPGHAGRSRSIELSGLMLHFSAWMLGISVALLVLMAGTWIHFAAKAARVGPLEDEVARLEAENRQVAAVIDRVQEVEAAYARLRSLFGSSESGTAEIWLPPSTGRAGPIVPTASGAEHPTSWPLSERGYITQALLEGAVREHPGVDVAVPSDSYIRAAGAGTVAEVGDDPVLGFFAIIDHADGYRSLYAHASSILVTPGAEVRQNEVIALVGSSGQSTAPHLHFEILLNGERVDPLTMVTQP